MNALYIPKLYTIYYLYEKFCDLCSRKPKDIQDRSQLHKKKKTFFQQVSSSGIMDLFCSPMSYETELNYELF